MPALIMEWSEDPEVWALTDGLIFDVWPSLEQLCEKMYGYRDQMPVQAQGILFGGFGQFTIAYIAARQRDDLDPVLAFGKGMEAVSSNPFFQRMMESQMHQLVDAHVDNLEAV